MPTFWAFRHVALYRGWTPRTGKCSTIGNVEGKTAFWTINYMFLFFLHIKPHYQDKPLKEVLKTFLEISSRYNAKILTTFKAIVSVGRMSWEGDVKARQNDAFRTL